MKNNTPVVNKRNKALPRLGNNRKLFRRTARNVRKAIARASQLRNRVPK